jgi:low affinity Fe/Cu permease
MIRRLITAFAAVMGTVGFFVGLLVIVGACSATVAVLGQASPTAVGIIFAMSAFSLVQCGAILVAQHEDEKRAHHRDEALHLKLDGLIKGVDTVDDALIGIEKEIDDAPSQGPLA